MKEAHWAGDVLIALEYNWTSMKNYRMVFKSSDRLEQSLIRTLWTFRVIYIYIYINRPIYKGFHKTLCINFRACAAFFPKIMYMSSGQEWCLSVGDNPLIFDFFKMFRSCLFKRFLIKTGNEMKRRLWHQSKKFCISVRSDSDAP